MAAVTDRLSPGPTEPFTLQVGERQFVLTKETLRGTLYAGQISVMQDGMHFLNADGDTFKHILYYLRTKELPILWNSKDGFDYATYAAIHAQASKFGLDELAFKIKVRGFEPVVKSLYDIETLEEGVDLPTPDKVPSNEQWEFFNLGSKRKVYVCPRGIHGENTSGCGRACSNAQPVGENVHEFREIARFAVVKRRLVFDPRIDGSNSTGYWIRGDNHGLTQQQTNVLDSSGQRIRNRQGLSCLLNLKLVLSPICCKF